MEKTAIFEDIISIMSHDSSTIKDRKGCDLIAFEKKMTDDMSDDAFLYQGQVLPSQFWDYWPYLLSE